MITRRDTLRILAGSTMLPAAPMAAWAQAGYPDKPLRYIVPFAAGGLTDVMARLIGQKLSDGFGQPVIVENRPGASANLGADQVARSAPDGYTLLAVTLTHAVNPSLYSDLPYNVQKDLQPVAHLATSPLVLVVNAASPHKDLKSFLAAAKARRFNGGSSGNGTPPHLGLELLALASGTEFTHVPYKGGAPSINDLMGNQIDFIVSNLPESINAIKGDRLRALAVTSAKRIPLLPDVPTFAEAGVKGVELENWTGMMAPAGTPRPVVDKLAGAAIAALKAPGSAEKISELGFSATGLGPDQFGKILNADVERWRDIVKRRNIKAT
ncbi:MAG: tripartite tricarboxylate transporter substrate binding protein [Proteobacteria bacterium]|nr:tripartite tricarboxylate transporter substrate binding protein [Pseudomonadota bacterium]